MRDLQGAANDRGHRGVIDQLRHQPAEFLRDEGDGDLARSFARIRAATPSQTSRSTGAVRTSRSSDFASGSMQKNRPPSWPAHQASSLLWRRFPMSVRPSTWMGLIASIVEWVGSSAPAGRRRLRGVMPPAVTGSKASSRRRALGSCLGCHSTAINGVQFALNYDDARPPSRPVFEIVFSPCGRPRRRAALAYDGRLLLARPGHHHPPGATVIPSTIGALERHSGAEAEVDASKPAQIEFRLEGYFPKAFTLQPDSNRKEISAKLRAKTLTKTFQIPVRPRRRLRHNRRSSRWAPHAGRGGESDLLGARG